MMKKVVVPVVLIILIAVVGWFYLVRGNDELASEKAAKLEIATYSMEGEVMIIGESEVTVRAGRVVRTPEGNKVEEFDQRVAIAETIDFSVLYRADLPQQTFSRSDFLTTIGTGDRVVFYGSGSTNKLGQEVFTANRAELIKKGK